MQTLEVDLAIIGAGPAGQKGAVQGAKAGQAVALIDRLSMLGGASLNQGTIPSKTLRMAILDLTGFMHSTYFGQNRRTMHEVSIADLKTCIVKVIEEENRVLQDQCEANGIQVLHGSARFADEHLVEILDAGGQVTHEIVAAKSLIATGSRPRHPIDVPDEPAIFLDSDQVFRIEQLPERLIVLGAGIIGCEYATMFAALGADVVLVDRRDGVLRMLDGEVGQRFVEHVQRIGVDLRLGQNIKELRRSADGQAEIVLADGECIKGSCMFYSLGREANVESLNLERAGIELDERGYIPVNALFQTQCPHIYAAGDVIGPPSLASTSMEQGRLAVRNAFLLKSHHFPEFFPYGIYTVPEISSVGPTEEVLRERGIRYEVGHAEYHEMGRGPIAGDTTGMIKLLFHAETLEVLAVHIIGTNATELIPLGQMAIDFHARIDYFIDTIFNYPTFVEGYRIAALNGLNKLQGKVDSSLS
jgi:NAD(P) transhydrogenase